jgi:hypothetical protein
MIRRAKDDLIEASENSEIEKIVSDLEDLEVAVPVAERYPEPIPKLETGRPRRPQPVERRVPSSYDQKEDPFDRDDTPVRLRAAVFAALALLVIGVAVAVLFASAA